MKRPRNKPIGLFPPVRPPADAGSDAPDSKSPDSNAPDKPVGLFPPAAQSALAESPSPDSEAVDEQEAGAPLISEVRLNKRFVTISALTAVGVALVFFVLHYVQDDRLASDLLKQAKAVAEREPERAAKRFREYLKFRQDDLDARIELARLQMQTAESGGQWTAAFRTNEAILRSNPDLSDIRRQHVDVCVRLARFKEARDHLDHLLQLSPDDGALHMLLGLAYEADRRFRDAAREYGLVTKDDDFESVEVADRKWTKFQAYSNHARILHEELNDPNSADRVFRAMLKKYPASSDAYLMRAGYRRRTGQPKYAAADARKALELDPDNQNALLLAAELTLADPLSAQEDVDSLHAALEAAVSDRAQDDSRKSVEAAASDRAQDDSQLYFLLAEYERRQGNIEKVVATLEQGVEQASKNDALNGHLIDQLISLGRIDQARAKLQERQETTESKNAPDSLYLEAGILLREGQPAEALKRLEQARTEGITNSRFYQLASLQIGQCCLAMGRPQDALREFNSVLSQDRSSAEAAAGVAAALTALGRTAEAVRARRELPLNSLSAALELARLELRVAMERLPEERHWKPVETALQAAEEFDPESHELSLLRSMMLVARGQREEAKQILQLAASRQPLHVGIIGALAQLTLEDGEKDRAAALLDDAAARLPDDPELDLYRLAFWRATDPEKFTAALQEFETKEYVAHSESHFVLLQSIAAWHRSAGRDQRALDLQLKATESRADHVDSWLQLLGLALDLNREDVRERALSEIQRLTSDDDVYFRCAQAMILIRDSADGESSDKRDQARQLLQEIVEERNDWSPPYALLGQLDLSRGKRSQAAEWYRLAVLHGNRDSATLRLTSQLLMDLERTEEAIELFEEIRSSASGELRNTTTQLMARIFAAQDREADMLRLLRDSSAGGAVGSTDHIMRGHMNWMSGAYDAAEADFRSAVEQSPEEAGGWLALISFLMRRGMTERAAEVVDQAETVLAAAGNQTALAQCYELTGRTQDAEQQLAGAVEAEPNSGAARYSLASYYVRKKRWNEASQLLDPLLNSPNEFPDVDRLAVRRLKAASIAFTSFAGFQSALQLLQTNIDEAVDRSTDQRMRAWLLVNRTHPDSIHQGLQLYEILERKVALKPEEELLVAMAYDRLRDDSQADGHWQALLTDYSQQPQVIEGYVRRQLHRGELDGLRKYIRQLQSLPDSWTGVELATQLELREGRIDQALAQIDQYIAEEADSELRNSRMTRGAGLLTALASSPRLSEPARTAAIEKADAFYQELLTADRSSTTHYAQLLAQHGNLEQALDLLEQEESVLPAHVRVSAGIQLLQFADHDNPQVKRVEAWVRVLREQHPDSTHIMLFEEAVCRRQQRYDAAIELNRQVLTQEPQQIVSLNNLAWILSTQQGEHQEAYDLLETAIKIAGPTSFLLDTRGLVSLEAGRLQAAIDDFETSWLQERLPATQFHLALAFAKFGDECNARDHLQQAFAAGLDPRRLEGPEVSILEDLRSQLGLNADATD